MTQGHNPETLSPSTTELRSLYNMPHRPRLEVSNSNHCTTRQDHGINIFKFIKHFLLVSLLLLLLG